MEVAQNKAYTAPSLRILYVITKSNWGGAQRYVYDLAVAGKERGHHTLVAAGGEGELIVRLKEAGVPVYSIGGLVRNVHLTREWRAFWELYALFRKERPDVVHVNSSKAGLAALAARLSGVQKIVFTVHGWAWNEKRPYYQKVLIALLYWLTLLLSSTNIVVSKAARTQAKYFPFVQRKFHVVYNGIHPLKFLTREGARTQLLKNAQDRFWVGTIAELHPIKGLDVLIEAFEQFLVQYPESELIIIGEGEERHALETEIAHRNLSSRVHLVGHKRDAATLLAAFDIFVLPSRSEGLAYVLLEAGQARLPVLATKVGGIPEVIEHGETGLLVPYGNLPLLTKELKYLASNQTVRRVLGDALHAHVDSDFSIPQMLTNTFALYEPKYS